MMVNNSNNINTAVLKDEMKQMMSVIYEELRRLFFSHAPRKLPQFRHFVAPGIELSGKMNPLTLGKYPIEKVIDEVESIIHQILTDNELKDDRLKEAARLLDTILRNFISYYKWGESSSEFKDLWKKLCDIIEQAKTDGGEAINSDGYKKIIKAMDLLKNIQRTTYILGEFIPEIEAEKRDKIILYYKANERFRGRSTLRTRMLVTLAHELFHAMHCSVIGKDKWVETEHEDIKTVIESLARWAEYCWCKHQKQSDFENIAENLELGWEISDFPSDPYSGAKVFDNEGVIDLDIDVLNASIKDWNKAYAKIDSHRNFKFLKGSIDDEKRKLNKKLTRDSLIYNMDTKDWAIIYLHHPKMNEWYNLTSRKLVQYELEQSGFEVICIPYKNCYFKRNNKLGWGTSALLFIKNEEMVPTKYLFDSIVLIANKHVNTDFDFFGAVSLRLDTGVVHLLDKGYAMGRLNHSCRSYYDSFNVCWILDISRDIFCKIEAIKP